jgi:DNA-binding transcriptional ArsR family regulator
MVDQRPDRDARWPSIQILVEVAASDLPGRDVFDGASVNSWDAALRLLASDSGPVPRRSGDLADVRPAGQRRASPCPEFPAATQARSVLGTIGAEERTFANIGRKARDLQQMSLSRSLKTLTDKRVVAAERPLSTTLSKETRYRIADPYLRFWLAFLGPFLPEIERGRGDRVMSRIQAGWKSWRGRAVEPVVREALDHSPAQPRTRHCSPCHALAAACPGCAATSQ